MRMIMKHMFEPPYKPSLYIIVVDNPLVSNPFVH